MKSSITRSVTLRLATIFSLYLSSGVRAFQLSMVATRAPLGNIGSSTLRKSPDVSKQLQFPGSVTNSLISQLAVAALKRRLHGQTHVSCDVTANPSDILLRGMVGPVTVTGRGWQSRLGLTCRAIEASVNTCELDISRILTSQKLVLTTPAQGNALVALNAVDFGNFITHPRMRPPGLPEADGKSSGKLEFLKDDVTIDVESGSIHFLGTYMDAKWKFTLKRGNGEGGRAIIKATPPETREDSSLDYEDIAAKLTSVTSDFFNKMVFELDGTFLNFRDMMLTSKGGGPTVMLSLGILVKKFPSPGIAF